MESLINIFEDEDYESFFIENAERANDFSLDEIAEILYPFPRIAEKNVVKAAEEMANYFKLTGKIPNVMISGSAGIGKTSLEKNIAKCFVQEDGNCPDLIVCSASSLLGKYVGHTEGRVFDLLKKADESNSIIFIDEAYVLMDSPYGQEAVAMLLPIMSGDRKTIEKVTANNTLEKTESYTFLNGAPPIWISGYDKELRQMAGKNEGFYRRFTKKINIPRPCPTALYNALIRYAQGLPDKWAAFSAENAKTLVDAFALCREDILAFFRYGTSCENERIFANYAGMEDFCESCASILDGDMDDCEIAEKITQIINDKKAEIVRQYSSCIFLKNAGGDYSFRIENDAQGSFSDIVGMDAEKEEFSVIINAMSGGNKYTERGVFIPKGVLLAGFPGCGKTALARAVAGELGKAFLKNGIDKTLIVELPEKEVRIKLIRFFLDRISDLEFSNEYKDAFAEEFAEKTGGFTPAELQSVINDSVCLYFQAEEASSNIAVEKFPHRFAGKMSAKRSAIDNFRLDVFEVLARRCVGNMIKSEKESAFSTEENEGCSATAVHEVGHGLVSLLLGQKPFEKITIIPRGEALGYVEHDRSEKLRTKKQILNRICVLLGGRIAEELFYGADNISIGAAQDSREATHLARQIVEKFGMSDEFGMMTLTEREGRFLGDADNYTCSDSYHARADEEINKLLHKLYSDTYALLSDNVPYFVICPSQSFKLIGISHGVD